MAENCKLAMASLGEWPLMLQTRVTNDSTSAQALLQYTKKEIVQALSGIVTCMLETRQHPKCSWERCF